MPFVYMLRCRDGSYYIGSTWSLQHRFAQHASGNGAEYTKRRLPVELVWAHETERVDDAYALEKRIQNWSRAKREALIRGDWDAVHAATGNASQIRRKQAERALDLHGAVSRPSRSTGASMATMSNQTLAIGLPLGVRSAFVDGLRRMEGSDLPRLVDLWFTSYPPAITAESTREDAEADWTAALAGRYGTLAAEASLVVEREGRIVAAIQTVVDAPWSGTPAGPFVIEVIVHPEFRRQGIARALLLHALHGLAMKDFVSAGLRVEHGNSAAQSLYRGLGFVEWSPAP